MYSYGERLNAKLLDWFLLEHPTVFVSVCGSVREGVVTNCLSVNFEFRTVSSEVLKVLCRYYGVINSDCQMASE